MTAPTMPSQGSLEASIEESKLQAALHACGLLEKQPEIRVLGLGTGSTVKKFIDVCLERLQNLILVASSVDTTIYAKTRGLRVVDLLTVDSIDLYIDGADEVNTNLDLVKGRGGALFREKTLAYMASKRVYIVDYTKYTGKEYLYSKSIPIEVVPFALNYVIKTIVKSGLFQPGLRIGSGKDGPVVTDNGNYIVDLKPLKPIDDALRVHRILKSIHGVVETGLFPSIILVDVVIVGYPGGARIYEKRIIS